MAVARKNASPVPYGDDHRCMPGQFLRFFIVFQIFGTHLTLRDYDAQVGEAMAMIRALNKMTLAGMPKSVRVA